MCGPIGDVLAASSHSRSSMDHMLLESSADDRAYAEASSTSSGPTTFGGAATLVPDDIIQDATSTNLQEEEVIDRPNPIASRMITEQDEDEDDSTGEAITPRPVVRGKTIEHMAKQALAAASSSAQPIDDISREDINDVANDRQLRPYHDLSTASDAFIQRRRDCILKVRAEQLGTIYTPTTTVSFAPEVSSQIQPTESWSSDASSTNEDGVMDDETKDSIKAALSRAGSTLSIDAKVQSIDLDDATTCHEEEATEEEEHPRPVRLSKRQATLAAQGKLKKLSSSFVEETSDEEYEDGASTPQKRGRRATRLKRSGSAGRSMTGKSSKKAEFPIKLHKMLDEVDPNIVAWLPHGRAFRVNDIEAFVDDILPAYGFNQTKITSFYRQLNLYGFSRMVKGPDAGGYYHECFLRGKPHLIKGMVRVKVKGGGNRPKPSEIAKTQPNFYAMPPIDAEAGVCAASGIGKEATAVKSSKKAKTVKEKSASSSKRKKRKSKCKKASGASSSPELPSREIIISPIPLIEPGTFEPIALGAGMVEDCGDSVPAPMPIKRSSAPSQALLEYHRQHPTQGPRNAKPNEITPSPVPPRLFNPTSSQASFHEHVLPPPLYNNSAQKDPAFAPFSSSTFHMHQHMLKQQQAASARSVVDFPNAMIQVNTDDPDQRPGEISNQKATDAELLVEDWYNINKPSTVPSQDLLGREADATDELWLPASPINVPLEGEHPVDYLEAVENAKDDGEFGQVLDAFLDSL